MPQVSKDLISTRIKKTSKQKLEFAKAIYSKQNSPLGKSDYAILEHLIDQEYDRALSIIKNQPSV